MSKPNKIERFKKALHTFFMQDMYKAPEYPESAPPIHIKDTKLQLVDVTFSGNTCAVCGAPATTQLYIIEPMVRAKPVYVCDFRPCQYNLIEYGVI